MEFIIAAVVGIICLVLGVVLGYVFGDKTGFKKGYKNRLEIGEKAIGSAEKEAERIVAEAVKKGEAKCKEMVVEAKEEILKSKTEAERENKERRQEILRLENKALAKGAVAKIWNTDIVVKNPAKMKVTIPENDVVLIHIK